MHVSGQEASGLQRRFERYGESGGGVEYRELCRALLENDDDDLRFVAGAVAAKLFEQQRRGLDVALPCSMADASRSGFCSVRDFRDAIKTLELPMSESDLQRFAAKFGQSGSYGGLVAYTAFLDYVRDAMPQNAPQTVHRSLQGHTRAIEDEMSLAVPVRFDTISEQKRDETKPTRPLTASESNFWWKRSPRSRQSPLCSPVCDCGAR